jgi:hypothetical protein
MEPNPPQPDRPEGAGGSQEMQLPGAIDQTKLQMLMQRIRDEQNLSLGILGGLVGAAIGAVLWAALSYFTGLQMGLMSIVMGFLVGFSVRKLGRGIDRVFGVTGALLSLVGCVVGDFLAICALIARHEGMSFFDVLGRVDYQMAWEMIAQTFNITDLISYAIALYFGYRFSIRTLTAEEIESVKRR